MRSDRQRMTYIMAARKAYAATESQLPFGLWRDEAKEFALGRSKPFSAFNNFDLSKALIYFWALARHEPISQEQIALRAIDRLQFKTDTFGRGTTVRRLWDAVASRPRATAMQARFKISFFEELALLDYDEIVKVVWMLDRIGKSHPTAAKATVAAGLPHTTAAARRTRLSLRPKDAPVAADAPVKSASTENAPVKGATTGILEGEEVK